MYRDYFQLIKLTYHLQWFVNRVQELSSRTTLQLKKALGKYFATSSFTKAKSDTQKNTALLPPETSDSNKDHSSDSAQLVLYTIPMKLKDDSISTQPASYNSMLCNLRDKVPSISTQPANYHVCVLSFYIVSGTVHEHTIIFQTSIRARLAKELGQNLGNCQEITCDCRVRQDASNHRGIQEVALFPFHQVPVALVLEIWYRLIR